ncbi:MAG: pyridoxal phosphate-dependent aminotransferase [Ectothiorhodospiraceae bacterium AqS1]|nr:pyridoxal phosphate-dependent aminotransferase [Ectothiorhodospiraceae bacterium AqS1]
MQCVQAPIIPRIGELIRDCPGTISLGQGIVHYPPPEAARDALRDFFDDPQRHLYQHELGLPQLRARIESKLENENDIDIDRFASMVTAGGNMAFLTVMLAICDAGDEVVLVRPWFFNHEMAVRSVGALPVVVASREDYQLDLDAIRGAVGPKTRAIVTVSPNNPTGAVYTEEDLRAVNALCEERRLFHISDEVYEYFVFEGARHFSPASVPGAQNHTVAIHSLSKAYGFASWRVGYMAFPKMLLESIKKIQDTNIICVPVVSQQAAIEVLGAGRQWVQERMQGIASVRRRALEALSRFDGQVVVPQTKGAFYFFVRIEEGGDSLRLAEFLIEEHGVAVIPGIAFGMEEGCYLRVGYGAVDESAMDEGMRRLAAGLADPRRP